MLSDEMRKTPDGSYMSSVENWWHRRICEFADEVAKLEAVSLAAQKVIDVGNYIVTWRMEELEEALKALEE
jgi:hypothetical protein